MGKTPSRDNIEYWSQPEFSWVSIADLSGASKYIYATKESISRLAVEESGIKIIPANTVIMSFKLSIGKVSITPHPMYSNEAIMAFIDKGIVQLKPEYLYYLLLHRNWDEGTNKAVMGKTLNKATLSDVVIDVHSIEEQDKIVAVLDKVAEIIESYQRQLRTLDTLIKARFVEMFGDPVNNEMSWATISLDDACDGIGDGLHGTPEYDDSGEYPFINGNNLIDGTIEITPATRMVDEATYKEHYIEITDNAILISINGTLGKIAFYKGEKVMLGKSACFCNLKPTINREFVYGVMKSDAFAEFLERNSTKSTIKNVGLKTIRGFQLIIPPNELQLQFVQFARQVDKSKLSIQQGLEKVETLKKSLMQQYFG